MQITQLRSWYDIFIALEKDAQDVLSRDNLYFDCITKLLYYSRKKKLLTGFRSFEVIKIQQVPPFCRVKTSTCLVHVCVCVCVCVCVSVCVCMC